MERCVGLKVILVALWLGACAGNSSSGDTDASARDAGDSGADGGDAANDSCATQVSAGGGHTCARTGDGRLWCWGANDIGQLGDGTATGETCGTRLCRPSPVEVTALGRSVAEVRAGGLHSCARTSNGSMWCWGVSDAGQLGDGAFGAQSSPVQVTAMGTSVAQVTVGGAHTCALKVDGTVWCWGYNGSGQLGDGTTGGQPCINGEPNCRLAPVEVEELGNSVAEVGAGFYHTCARKTDGTVWCWGLNNHGQLGNDILGGEACADNSMNCRPLPVKVGGLAADAARLEVGRLHSCALKVDGTLWCWGFNGAWQLGEGAMGLNSSSPVEIESLGAAVAFTPGASLTCAVKVDGTLWCWGDNGFGALGNGTYENSAAPVQVEALATDAANMSGGESHTCFITTEGVVLCAGANGVGQLGNGSIGGQPCRNGTPECEPSPVQVVGLCL
jgi:alpha-tubulin suppressor-like RCC1 family protein